VSKGMIKTGLSQKEQRLEFHHRQPSVPERTVHGGGKIDASSPAYGGVRRMVDVGSDYFLVSNVLTKKRRFS